MIIIIIIIIFIKLDYVRYHQKNHHQLKVHFLPRLIKGIASCFLTALGRQSTFSNILGPLVQS